MTIVDKYIKFNNSVFLDWTIRILFTLSIIPLALHTYDHYQPLIIVVMSLLSIWLYFIKWRLVALIPLLYLMIFHTMDIVSWENHNADKTEIYIDSVAVKPFVIPDSI
jgi:hypothetical protein